MIFPIFLLSFLCVVGSGIATESEEIPRNYSHYDKDYGITWMYFPDGNDQPQICYLTEPKPKGRADPKVREPIDSKVNFQLYTRKSSRSPKKIQMRQSRDDKNDFQKYFRNDSDTKIVIHGWKSSTNTNTVQMIKDAYLSMEDVNVIAVDWEKIASNNFYPVPAQDTREVGRYTAELIDYLHTEHGADYKRIHIIGHSLGAHTAGYAGSYAKGRVSRITGLDPALPMFERNSGPESRLDISDAEFVDIIHSCAGILGFRSPLGHVDFYPNEGKAVQPGCNGLLQEFIDACSHGRSHQFYAESITSKQGFYGHYCNSWDSYLNDKCEPTTSIMGAYTPPTARGIYYLRTASQSPFALGNV